MKKNTRRDLLILSLPVALFLLWIVAEVIMYRRTVPPAHVRTFADFIAWHPDNRTYVQGMEFNKPCLVVFGSMSGLMPSGPSAYLFDENGTLVLKTSDFGDDGTGLHERFDRFTERKSITKEEALAQFAAASSQPQ